MGRGIEDSLNERQAPGSSAESRSCEEAGVWRRRTLWLIGCLLVVRSVVIATAPVDLAPDEAYYWDWSRQLDWGYFSKPPMVAWLNALTTRVGGVSPFSIRLSAVILATSVSLWLYALGARLYSGRAGFLAVLLFAATPMAAIQSLLMTVDAPFIFCWSAALYCLWRFLERGPDQYRWCLAATVASGLGLLSKEAMLGFFPLAGLFLLSGAADRRQLLRPAFWLWILGSLLFLTPVIWWNSRHDWVTPRHSVLHFVPEAEGWREGLSLCGQFLAGQFALTSPVTWGLFIAAIFAGLLSFRRLGRRERYLLCFGGLPFLAVAGLSFTRTVEGNWPAPLYLAGILLAVGWTLGQSRISSRRRIRVAALTLAAVVGVLMVTGLYLLVFRVGVQGTALDELGPDRLRGWRQLGQEVGHYLDGMPRSDKVLVVAVTHRGVASELAFFIPSRPRVYVWNDVGDISSQYDVWGGPRGAQGWDALIITADRQPPGSLVRAFARIEPLGRTQASISRRRSHRYSVWRGVGLREWPVGPPPNH